MSDKKQNEPVKSMTKEELAAAQLAEAKAKSEAYAAAQGETGWVVSPLGALACPRGVVDIGGVIGLKDFPGGQADFQTCIDSGRIIKAPPKSDAA
jgi:hypothetical protein